MTPYEKLLADKEKICCTNCRYLHQEPKKNKIEETDHVNYCTKSGKIVLEMHIDTVGKTKNCFERKGGVNMSDLISRSKIRDYIQTQINPYGKPFEGTPYELGLKIMKYIDAMDSACDLEKVDKGWIPVEERLPKWAKGDYLETVIVTLENDEVAPAFYRNDCEEWFVKGRYGRYEPTGFRVVAWQPLPKPYKEKESNAG